MRSREQYEAQKAERKARQERRHQAAEEAKRTQELARTRFWRHPDRIVRYSGSLQAYTFVLSIATIALVAATIYSAFILSRTDDAIHGQLEEIEIGQRHWVYADIKTDGGVYINHIKDSYVFPVVFTYHNTGKTPAHSVFIEIDASTSNEVGYNTRAAQEKVCASGLSKASDRSEYVGVAIFPGQIYNYRTAFAVSFDEWQEGN